MQRTWALKRSLQDKVTSLHEQIRRRNCLLDAICALDTSGDDVVRMLHDCSVSYDEVYKRVRGSDAGSVTLDITMGHSDYETEWLPSTVNSNLPSSTSSQSPFTFMYSTIDNDIMPRPLTNT